MVLRIAMKVHTAAMHREIAALLMATNPMDADVAA
jgi:hypothetical protein